MYTLYLSARHSRAEGAHLILSSGAFMFKCSAFLQAFILQSAHNWQSTAHVDRGLEITRVPDDGRSGCISY